MSNNFSISYVLKESFEILNKRRKYAVYPLVVLEMICGGMVPVLMVYVPKIIVDILEKQDMTWDNLKIIPTFLVGAMVVAIISLLCNSYFDALFVELRSKELQELHKTYQDIKYYRLENADYAKKAEAAILALQSPLGVEGIYRNGIKMLSGVVTFVIYILLLFGFNYKAASICMITVVLSVNINYRITQYLEKERNSVAQIEKQKGYFEKIGYDFRYGKDIRLFNMSEKLNKAYKKKTDTYEELMLKIAKQEQKLKMLETSIMTLGDMMIISIVIWLYFSSSITVGEVVLYMGMVFSISSLAKKMLQIFVDWIKCVSYGKNYYYFIQGISEESESKEIYNSEVLKVEDGIEVEFRDVSFRYSDSQKWILRHFNLKIKTGEKSWEF